MCNTFHFSIKIPIKIHLHGARANGKAIFLCVIFVTAQCEH